MRYLETESQIPKRQKVEGWLSEAGGRGEWGIIVSGYSVSTWKARKVLEVNTGDGCTTIVNILNTTELYT